MLLEFVMFAAVGFVALILLSAYTLLKFHAKW